MGYIWHENIVVVPIIISVNSDPVSRSQLQFPTYKSGDQYHSWTQLVVEFSHLKVHAPSLPSTWGVYILQQISMVTMTNILWSSGMQHVCQPNITLHQFWNISYSDDVVKKNHWLKLIVHYVLVITPPGEIWLIYKHNPQGREAGRGECLSVISHWRCYNWFISLITRCSFGKPKLIINHQRLDPDISGSIWSFINHQH